MSSTRKTQPQTFSFRDLTAWTTTLPDVKLAVLPPSNTRPNPLATEDRVYVSVFAPGAICALERSGGKLIWRTELGEFADASVYLHDSRLFAKTCNTLFALHPDSGKTLWSFCPYGNEGESIYSSPSAHDDRVYIGDRRGHLHCLDAGSGARIWSRRTNRAENCDVNSTPVLVDGLVVVTTNAKTVVAYNRLSGKLAWKQRLDGPSRVGPLVHKDSIVAVADSLYLLSPTGKVRRRFSWKDEKVDGAESTPSKIVAMFSSKSVWRSRPDKIEPNKLTLLVAKSAVQRTTTFVNFCPSVRYAPATRLLYLSHLDGIDLINAEKGTLLCHLKTSSGPQSGIGLVDVRDNKIYVLTGDGGVHALRHPVSKFTPKLSP